MSKLAVPGQTLGRGGVELKNLEVTFGQFVAVQPTNLLIRPGEFFSFLGPSGCGKTSLLRTISGFQQPSQGTVRIGGADMRRLGPNKRPTALVFQNLALFPLMTVNDNIAYGLRVRGETKATQREAAERLLELVSLTGQGHKKVGELSGGQRQRVAIARALAIEPSVLLLDEPLSALDLKLRQHMRTELRALQRRIGITFIYITHDQGEALAMSDRVAVMNCGRIEQVGTPREVYNDPATPFVASFVGENNVVHGRVRSRDGDRAVISTETGDFVGRAIGRLAVGDGATFYLRPEALSLQTETDNMSGLSGEITDISYEGSAFNIRIIDAVGRGFLIKKTSSRAAAPAVGDQIRARYDPDAALIMARDGTSDDRAA